jgi:hypothetical protein
VQKKSLSTVKNTSPKITYALKVGSSFALERPITFDSLRNTLQAAYGMIGGNAGQTRPFAFFPKAGAVLPSRPKVAETTEGGKLPTTER